MAPHSHHRGHVHVDEADWQAVAAQTEMEGELLLGFVTGAIEQVKARRGPDAAPVRGVLDIGSGPGVGTCELARLFPDAQVVALDGSPAMLSRAAQRAQEHGFGARIGTHLAELPGGLDGLEPVDLIWASMSLHHVGDEVGVLRLLRDLLTPGGLVAIAEGAGPMRIVPDVLDIGRPGLAERLAIAGTEWFAAMREGLGGAVPSADLSSMLVSAGFEVLSSEAEHQTFDPPLSDFARQVVIGHLRRTRNHLEERLDQEDLEVLDILANPDDPRGALHRLDLFVAASRQIAIARPRQD